ncbi:MAG: hypothetical protein IKA77_03665 [Clostridia bacterium]|nr:hypothetical protein [Clostridia bacterium]
MIGNLLSASKAYAEFYKDAREQKLSHAYIIIGDDALARNEYRRLMASTVLCPHLGCGECDTCNKIYNDSHLGVEVYNLDGKMNVKEAERLIEEAQKSSWEGGRKLYFIDNADKLSPQVQNKLLKIFEEPPKDLMIVMMASSANSLLQTIKSRAKINYLPRFSAEQLYNELVNEGYPRATAETASMLAGGSYDRALKFAQDEGYNEQYAECFNVLMGCKNSTMVADYIYNPIFSKEKIALTLEFIEIILRDVAVKVSGANTPYYTRNRDYDIGLIAEGFTSASVAMAILEVATAEQMLASYVNATTVAERVLFKILEAKYKWQ